MSKLRKRLPPLYIVEVRDDDGNWHADEMPLTAKEAAESAAICRCIFGRATHTIDAPTEAKYLWLQENCFEFEPAALVSIKTRLEAALNTEPQP